jgi:hypothetical protein
MAKAGGIAKKTSGRSTWAKPATPRTGRFNARGRGRAALARGIGPKKGFVNAKGSLWRARKAIVKVSVVKLRGHKTSGGGLVRGQLAYLQREEAGVARVFDEDGNEKSVPCHGQLYGPEDGVEIDGRDFVARSTDGFDGRGDPHQFRIILSPEDGAKLAAQNARHVDPDDGNGAPNLRRTTRALMEQMEADLGTRLDWVAVDHFDTAHPHTHVLVRGSTHDGKGLNIAGEYIGKGIRGRLEEQLTKELGLKNIREIRREAERDLDAMRITPVDKNIIRRMNSMTNVIDLREGQPSVQFGEASDLNRHILIRRMKNLEKMELATATDTGRWQIKPDAFETLRAVYARNQLNEDLHAAMERAGITRPVRLEEERSADDRDVEVGKRIIGRVISKGLANGEGMETDAKRASKVRLIIDGSDGYVRAVETSMDSRAGAAAKVGSIIEVGPPRLRKVDRSIRDIARGNDYRGNPNNGEVNIMQIDYKVSGPFGLASERQQKAGNRAHRLRLATLAKGGVVRVTTRANDGEGLVWQVPEDFERRAVAMDLRQGRATGVSVLSVATLDQMTDAPGATWLDRSQVSHAKGEIAAHCSPQSAFGKELDQAFLKRRAWLLERGHAELRNARKDNTTIHYKRGFVKELEQAGFNAATAQLEARTSKQFVAAQTGRMIEGTVTQKFELPHGPHAMIETQRAFYLVPWQNVHDQTWGKRIHGRVKGGGGIDWKIGRRRDLGIGR